MCQGTKRGACLLERGDKSVFLKLLMKYKKKIRKFQKSLFDIDKILYRHFPVAIKAVVFNVH